jgi:hypothetical protein
MPRLLFALVVSLSALVAGCGGGPTFDGVRYQGKGVAFRVAAHPASWSRLDVSEGLLAFRDAPASATILVNGRCGKDGDDVPLSALTQHLFLLFTERTIEEEEIFPMDGREAQRTVLRAKLDGVPKRFETVVLKKDGCVYDLILIAEPDTFASARPAFDGFAASFRAEASR